MLACLLQRSDSELWLCLGKVLWKGECWVLIISSHCASSGAMVLSRVRHPSHLKTTFPQKAAVNIHLLPLQFVIFKNAHEVICLSADKFEIKFQLGEMETLRSSILEKPRTCHRSTGWTSAITHNWHDEHTAWALSLLKWWVARICTWMTLEAKCPLLAHLAKKLTQRDEDRRQENGASLELLCYAITSMSHHGLACSGKCSLLFGFFFFC